MQFTDRKDCCGCTGCMTVCPKKAIEMVRMENGFLYPRIDETRCTQCGRCREICPILNYQENKELSNHYYGVKATLEKRKNSTSGGVFQLLSEEVLKSGGMVFGAAFDENLVLIQTGINGYDKLKPLLKSKYIQVDLKNTFQEVKELLEQGVPVLFAGTPCVIESLNNVLSPELRKKILLVDFVCSGVPSPGFWEAYKKHQGKDGGIQSFEFRSKLHPNSGHTVVTHYKDLDREEGFLDNKWCRIFSKSIGLRNSCYSCHWCSANRVSDITLGDFWGIDKVMPEFDDGYGVSLVITHNNRGEEAFSIIQSETSYFETDFDSIQQPRLKEPSKMPLLNKLFEKDLVARGTAADCDVDLILKKYGN